MCEPMTIMAAASLAIGALTAYTQHEGQKDAAKSQQRYNERTQANAELQRKYDIQQLSTRQIQEGQAAGDKIFQNSVDAAQARSRAAVGAEESGVTGASVDAIARDFYMQQGQRDQSVQNNANNAIQQLQMEKVGSNIRAAGRSIVNEPQKPSLFSLALGIGQAGMNAYDTYDKYSNPKRSGKGP